MRKSIASRWWPRQLRIALCPDKVVVAVLERSWRLRVVDKRIIEVPQPGTGEPWRASVAALTRALGEFARPNLSATVILSNHFVRYAVVPWRDNVVGAVERLALARHCFRSIHGDVASHWDVRLSDGGFRHNAIVSAIDREFVTELDQAFAQSKIALLSAQPYFMTACNRFRRQIKSQSGCLAVLERGRATLGIFDRDGWQALAARRIANTDPEALAPLLAQELQSATLAEAPEHLYVAAVEDPRVEYADAGWSTRVLRLDAQAGFSPLDDARYAMALCGVA